MAIIRSSEQITNVADINEKFRYIQIFLQDVKETVNGNLELAVNNRLNIKTVLFSQANTDVVIEHGLGRIPNGYIVVGLNSSAVIFEGPLQKTVTTIGLRATVNCTAKLIFI